MLSKFTLIFVILASLNYKTFAHTDSAPLQCKNYVLSVVSATSLALSVVSLIAGISMAIKHNDLNESSCRDRRRYREEINNKEQELVTSQKTVNALKKDCLVNEETVSKLQKALNKQKNVNEALVRSNKNNETLFFYHPGIPADRRPTKQDVIEFARLIKAWMTIFALTGVEWECSCHKGKSCGQPGYFTREAFICDSHYIDKTILGGSFDTEIALKNSFESLYTIAKNNPCIALPGKYKHYMRPGDETEDIFYVESIDDLRQLINEYGANKELLPPGSGNTHDCLL